MIKRNWHLRLEGKKSKFQRKHFENLGKGWGLTDKQISGVFDRFYNKKNDALKWVNSSFLSKKMKENYIGLLDNRYKRIY